MQAGCARRIGLCSMWALIVELSGGLGKLLLVGSLTLTEPAGLMQRITSGLQSALSATAFFNPA